MDKAAPHTTATIRPRAQDADDEYNHHALEYERTKRVSIHSANNNNNNNNNNNHNTDPTVRISTNHTAVNQQQQQPRNNVQYTSSLDIDSSSQCRNPQCAQTIREWDNYANTMNELVDNLENDVALQRAQYADLEAQYKQMQAELAQTRAELEHKKQELRQTEAKHHAQLVKIAEGLAHYVGWTEPTSNQHVAHHSSNNNNNNNNSNNNMVENQKRLSTNDLQFNQTSTTTTSRRPLRPGTNRP